jgi:hypothetical protein
VQAPADLRRRRSADAEQARVIAELLQLDERIGNAGELGLLRPEAQEIDRGDRNEPRGYGRTVTSGGGGTVNAMSPAEGPVVTVVW